MREGSEEYLDSEKYEIKQRALDGPLLPMVRRINEIRRENPALQRLENVTFLETYNEALIAYVKSVPGNTVICVVNIDPAQRPGGRRRDPRPSRPAARLRGARPALGRRTSTGASAATTCAWSRVRAHVLRVEA